MVWVSVREKEQTFIQNESKQNWEVNNPLHIYNCQTMNLYHLALTELWVNRLIYPIISTVAGKHKFPFIA